MQPYERRRNDELTGTTGSRLPGFPVATTGEALVGEVAEPREPAIGPIEPQRSRIVESGAQGSAPPVRAGAGVTKAPPPPTPLPAKPRPGPKGIWIEYDGQRWTPDGKAVAYSEDAFVRLGEYRGFPVYGRRTDDDPSRVFLPTTPGMVAPYRRQPS
jgi:hypothetical protein